MATALRRTAPTARRRALRRSPWALLAVAAASLGCAGRDGAAGGHLVEFRAPAVPDAEFAELLKDVERIGVLSATNVEPVQSLDVEKVMGRLTDATARALEGLPGLTVVAQDEIRWRFRDAAFDSAAVFGDSLKTALMEDLQLDAVVHVTLRSLQAQMTPISPSPYGAVPSPGVNLSVELEVVLANLHSGRSWSEKGRRSSWEPMQVDLLGGGRDRTEQQLMGALAAPLRQFLARVAPPPSRETRQFDVSGD